MATSRSTSASRAVSPKGRTAGRRIAGGEGVGRCEGEWGQEDAGLGQRGLSRAVLTGDQFSIDHFLWVGISFSCAGDRDSSPG